MMIKTRGFTIIELMITVAVLAVVAGLAAPGFRSIIQNNRATTTTNDLVTALQLARSEAMKRRADVMVCRRNTAGTACDNATNWATGWLILGGGTVIQVWDPPNGSPTITASANTLTFTPTGRVSAAGSYSISFPSCTGQQGRTITVLATGRATTTKTACP